MMYRKLLLLVLVVCLMGTVDRLFAAAGMEGSRPNMVFFLADDQSKFDHSAYGNELAPTPVTQKFADEGLVFERMFTGQAICAPSRSMLYTGLDPIRNGCILNHTPVRPGIETITKYMGDLGYEVILAGKSHVAPDEQFQWTKRFQPVKVAGLPRPWIPVEEMDSFMKNPGDKPFCMIVASEFPHGPHIKETSFGNEDIKVQSFIEDTPDNRKSYTTYYQSIVEKEKEFQAVLDMIDKRGLRDNTVVFYADDHGHKRGKFTVYDSGLNVAFMVRWPGKIKPGRTAALASFTDFVPTAVELAGGVSPVGIDGKSLIPVLAGKTSEHHDYVYGVAHNQGIQQRHVFPQRSVHDGRFHYIVNFNSLEKIERDRAAGETIDFFFEYGARKHSGQLEEELYDTHADPDEISNIAGKEEVSASKARLRKQLFQWLEKQGDYLGEEGPVLFLQGRQHELDEQGEKYGYKIPDVLVGSLEGRKYNPHTITGENREVPDPGEPITTECSPRMNGPPAGRNTSKLGRGIINWEKALSKNDLVWTNGIGDHWGESAFIANGLTGASIYRMPGDDWVLRWELGRTDVAAEYHIPDIDWSIPRVPIGNIVLNPAGKVEKADMRLDIRDAEARGTIKTDKGNIQWRSFIDRDSNVVVIDSESFGGEAGLALDLAEQWAISGRIPHTQTDPSSIDPKHLPPKPYRDQIGDITVAVQPLTKHGAHATAFVNLPGKKGRNVFLLSVGKVFKPELSRDDNIAQAIKQAVDAVSSARTDGVAKLESRHRQWWHDYMAQAYVSLPNDPRWEKFYWLQIYKFGGASRADVPIITDNMGPWFTQCGWPGTWWNLNVQLSYYPTFSGNRMDVGRSMLTAIDYFHATGKLGSPEDPDAYSRSRTSTYNLQRSNGTTKELGNLTWVLHNYWRYYRYSMDEQVARNLFPILKRNINYYFKVMETDADGTLHLPPMVSPEYNSSTPKGSKPGLLRDTNYSLQLFQWGLQTLIDLNEELGLNDPAFKDWKKALKKLTPLPVGEFGLKISAEEDYNFSHRHYSHLLALYPLHTITPDQGPEAEELFLKSVERWQSMPNALASYSYTGSAAMFATLGDGNRAVEKLEGMLGAVLGAGLRGIGDTAEGWGNKKVGIMWNSMYAEGGGPVIETPLSVVESIGYMLIQSWDGIIRVFPGMPDRWADALYHNLRTEGAFLVSAERKGGETKWIRIESLAGEPLVLQTDMTEFKADRDIAMEPVEGPRGQKRWKIELKKGETVLLQTI